MEDIISVVSANKTFKETKALQDITISFAQGKIHGIIGRNGSGKTVLLKCICGLMKLDTGIIKVKNQVVGKEIDIPKNIGAVIEAPGFLPNYSGAKNLKFLAGIHRKIAMADIEASMRTVGLNPTSRKHVGKYSLGMRQRLGIAQAIMENPDILIFDEPMNGLDNQGVDEIRQLLLELKERGKTILIASHNQDDIRILCDTVHEMDNGALLA